MNTERTLIHRHWLAVTKILSLLALLGATSFSVPASAQEQYGTIKGRVVWGGDGVPAPKVDDIPAKDQAVCGKTKTSKELFVDPKTKGIGNCFVYLLKPNGQNSEALKSLLEKEASVTIDQKKCEFIPFSTAMHQDQELVLKSSDPVNHNVRYSAFKNAAFNQILPPMAQTKVKLVAENRPLPLACDIHPWMKGAIMVFDHPFFAVTKEVDGSFEITGVPAGEQKLVIRQSNGMFVPKSGGNQGRPVKVEAGKTTDVGEVKIAP